MISFGQLCVALLVGCCLYGCASAIDPTAKIDADVEAIEPMAIELLCIEVNTGVKAALTDALFARLRELGLAVQSRQAAFGDECRFWLRYQAAWGGFPEHLHTAHVEVLDSHRIVGQVRYDATRAGGRPDRFGSAISKLAPLLEALFVRVQR